MRKDTLPIWRDASRLLLAVEQAVRHFPRYHKYTLGSELRTQAMRVCRLVGRAWRERERAENWLQELVRAVDDLKLQVQLAKSLQAFRNFAEFEQIAHLAVEVGKQSAPRAGLCPARPPRGVSKLGAPLRLLESGGWLRRVRSASRPEAAC